MIINLYVIKSMPKLELLFPKVWTIDVKDFNILPMTVALLRTPFLSVVRCYNRTSDAGQWAKTLKPQGLSSMHQHGQGLLGCHNMVNKEKRKWLFTERASIQGRKQETSGGGVGSLITTHTQDPGREPGSTLKTQSRQTSPDFAKVLSPQYHSGD